LHTLVELTVEPARTSVSIGVDVKKVKKKIKMLTCKNTEKIKTFKTI